jgi:hypothetical protein
MAYELRHSISGGIGRPGFSRRHGSDSIPLPLPPLQYNRHSSRPKRGSRSSGSKSASWRAVDVFKRAQIDLARSSERLLETGVRERRVGITADTLAAAASSMEETARMMLAVASQTEGQADGAASASWQASANVQPRPMCRPWPPAPRNSRFRKSTGWSSNRRISNQAVAAARQADDLVGGLDMALRRLRTSDPS